MYPISSRNRRLALATAFALAAAGLVIPSVSAGGCPTRFTSVADETPTAPLSVVAAGGSYASHRYNALAAEPDGTVWAGGSLRTDQPWTDPNTGETSLTHGDHPLVERWDGLDWRVTPIAFDGGGEVVDVDGVAANDAWAVGNRGWGKPLLLRWDGATWRHVSTMTVTSGKSSMVDDGFVLTGVAAVASDDVWAVGNSSGMDPPRILHWDGVAWRDDLAAAAAADNLTGFDPDLRAVAAIRGPRGTEVFVVGTRWDSTARGYRAFALHFDGSQWRTMVVPAGPSGGATSDSVLSEISATSPTDVWATGMWLSSESSQPAVWHFDGKHWTASTFAASGAAGVGAVAALAPPDGGPLPTVWVGGAQDGGTRGLFATLAGTTWETARRAPIVEDLVLVSHRSGWAAGRGARLYRVDTCH